MPDRWLWRVHMRSGATYNEYGPDGLTTRITPRGADDTEALGWENLAQIELLDGARVLASVVVPEDGRGIIYRTRTQTVSQGGESVPITTLHVIGYQQTVNGQNVKTLVVVDDDGAITVMSEDVG